MALHMRFITKVTNMGDRILIILPKDEAKTKSFKGKYVRVALDEITTEEEATNKK